MLMHALGKVFLVKFTVTCVQTFHFMALYFVLVVCSENVSSTHTQCASPHKYL